MAGLSESRQLDRLNVTPTDDLAGGTYRVGGRIDPDVSGFVNAPYSGERVVWVEYREERRTGSGDNRRWRTVNQGTG